ncbi:MAG: M48 family metalloprotease [Thermoproteales archaeon]|nr:M48 family metalloprotease [Thermoproteales archaeon]
MSIWKLRIAMLVTLTFIIGLSTLALTFILNFLGISNIIVLLSTVIAFNVLQWLIAPYLIDLFYNVKEIDQNSMPEIHDILRKLSQKAGIKTPKLMLANIPIPNAFAYGSPLTGNRVAITRGLLNVLNKNEIEAVIGHELGHLKHKDVQIMMLASVLPSLFYILGRSLIFSSYFGGRDEEDRGSASILIIGFLSMIIYFILSLFVLHLSRIREYYADNFSVNLSSTRKDGARNLMSALAKIVRYTGILKNKGATIKTLGFKELFIADPDITEKEIREASKFIGEDRFINEILNKRITFADKIMEIFSTHPNIVNRFKALYSYITESSS